MPHKTILVIEENKGQRQFFGTLLSEYTKDYGITISMAENVFKAKAIYSEKREKIIAIVFDACVLQKSSEDKTDCVLSWIEEISFLPSGRIFALYCFDFLNCRGSLEKHILGKGQSGKITVCKKDDLPEIIKTDLLSCLSI